MISFDSDNLISLLKEQLKAFKGSTANTVEEQHYETPSNGEYGLVARKSRGKFTYSNIKDGLQRKPLQKQDSVNSNTNGAGDSLFNNKVGITSNKTNGLRLEPLTSSNSTEHILPIKTFDEIYDEYKLTNISGVQWTTFRESTQSTKGNYTPLPPSPETAHGTLNKFAYSGAMFKLCDQLQAADFSCKPVDEIDELCLSVGAMKLG